MKRLTALSLKTLKREGFHRDRGDGAAVGLYVKVWNGAAGVGRSWAYRYTSPLTGKPRWLGLGPCELVSLAEARAKAVEARRLVHDGGDPIESRREARQAVATEHAKAMTFGDCVDGYLAAHARAWKNDKHRKQWRSTLGRAGRAFGSIDVRSVDTATVIKFLDPIWRKTPETGSRLRGRIESVLDWATARKFRAGENPARWDGHLEHLLAARPKAKHHAVMPFADVPAFMAELRKRNSISARALELTMLTAARTSEVLGAERGEIDLKARTWTVPADRMKAGKEHVIPLSDRAVEILGELKGRGVLFAGAKGRPLSNMAMLQLLRGMAGDYTVHGFRSSFRDWAGDCTQFDRETIEHALAHLIKDKAEAAYRRSAALGKRARLMQAWADYCGSKPAGVVAELRRA